MVVNNRPIIIPKPITQTPKPLQKGSDGINKTGFQDVLREKIQEQSDVKISKHAEMRMNARDIKINQAQMERVKKGIEKAQEKGVKEALVIVDNTALVVNVRNKTVVTAIDSAELKENVFTNIDGAVIV